jgi:hypothetical protein
MKLFRRRNPECRYWEDLLARFGVPGVSVREVIRVEDGYQVHGCPGRKRLDLLDLRELGLRLAVHKRLPRGAVCVEPDPDDAHAGAFVIRVRQAAAGAVVSGKGQ